MPGRRAAHSEQRYSESIFMCKAEHNIFLLGKDLIFLERLPLIHSRMDRSSRQRSGASSTGSTASVQPVVHHVRSGSVGFSSAKRTQNYAAKAAAQRLAQVMASQSNGDDEEDDSPFRYGSSCGSNTNSRASAHSRSTRSQSPALGRNLNGHTSSTRSTSTGRPSIAAQPLSKVLPSGATSKQRSSKPPLDPVADMRREKRFSADLNFQGEADNRREAASLHDEIDLLREENENLLNKLRLAEQKWQEAEAKARELEKQVASLGEGLSLEARLLNRKEAALRQREVAFRVEKQTKDVQDEEIAALRLEAKTARDEAAAAVEQVQVAEVEAKALRSMMQRMILTQEEMEEVVLKRCWLARYWGLAVRHGIHAEIASQKHEYWSSLAPLPLEVVMSAGQKSKEESTIYNLPVEIGGNEELDKRSRFIRELNDLSGEGNIESMLAVEKGLRELASLKVEDAIVLVMAEQRRLSLIRASHSFQELSEEEIEDVQFKQAWLIYFWRIAGNHGVEKDIVDDRFQYWVGRSNQSPTFHDVVDVERGLTELRKLGIEDQLWESSRKEIAPEFPHWKIGADIKAETAAL